MKADTEVYSLMVRADIHQDIAREAIRDLLAEHARELTEKIRGAHSGKLPDLSWVVNASDAADLIDPDKEKS